MLRRLTVPLLVTLCMLAASPKSHADTTPADTFPHTDDGILCLSGEVAVSLFQYTEALTVASCQTECDYSITVRLHEPLGVYNLRTYADIPHNDVGWHLMVNNTFVTIARLKHESAVPSCRH